jgi:hypothetical protein
MRGPTWSPTVTICPSITATRRSGATRVDSTVGTAAVKGTGFRRDVSVIGAADSITRRTTAGRVSGVAAGFVAKESVTTRAGGARFDAGGCVVA